MNSKIIFKFSLTINILSLFLSRIICKFNIYKILNLAKTYGSIQYLNQIMEKINLLINYY